MKPRTMSLLFSSIIFLILVTPGSNPFVPSVLGQKSRPSTRNQRVDNDRDGIPDAIETMLLARFTPNLRFSFDGGEEKYRPMEAFNYTRWSELQTSGNEGEGVIIANRTLFANPAAVLDRDTDITKPDPVTGRPRFRPDRFLNPLADVPQQGGDWARYGYAWTDVLARRNIGLYGHVVPFLATPPQTDFGPMQRFARNPPCILNQSSTQ